MMTGATWVRAVGNTVVSVDGRPFAVRLGAAYSSEDPVVRAHPGLFSAAPESPVERATRAPGELSNARRAR